MSNSNKKDLDDKILTLVWEDRKKDALIIQALKSKYETIEGKNFEETTVDDLVSSISRNWYKYVDGYKNLYNQDNWHNFVQTKTHEEAVYETQKLRQIIEGTRTNICFNKKDILLRTITVGKLIDLLLAKPELIP